MDWVVPTSAGRPSPHRRRATSVRLTVEDAQRGRLVVASAWPSPFAWQRPWWPVDGAVGLADGVDHGVAVGTSVAMGTGTAPPGATAVGPGLRGVPGADALPTAVGARLPAVGVPATPNPPNPGPMATVGLGATGWKCNEPPLIAATIPSARAAASTEAPSAVNSQMWAGHSGRHSRAGSLVAIATAAGAWDGSLPLPAAAPFRCVG